ncbi:MAG: hypothetical protein EOM23_00970 [Candidatus Moranbacteria bacterium]|nr:hypothetical protein [Candidatus Moranbacteria bacterium]
MKHLLHFAFAFSVLVSTYAQESNKRPLTHEDYDSWKNLRNIVFSPDGNWLAYEVNPQQGDGNLVLYNVESKTERVFNRGYDAVFSKGNGFLAFKVKQPEAILRQAKVEKKKRDEIPKDSLAILNLATQELEIIADLIGFSVPREPSNWMVYQIEVETHKPKQEESPEAPEIEEKEDPEPQNDSIPASGSTKKKPSREKVMVVYNPLTGHKESIEKVETFLISPTGKLASGVVQNKQGDTLTLNSIVVFETDRLHRQIIDDSREGEIKQMNVNFDGNQLAWLHSADTTKAKTFDVWLWNQKDRQPVRAIDSSTIGMPKGLSPSEHSRPYFSKNGKRLFIGTVETPMEEPKDTLLAEEKYSLDIWHWNEPMIQPLQSSRLRSESRRSFSAVYHIGEKKLVQLADEILPTMAFDHENKGDFALGLSPVPYLKMMDYIGGSFNDVYEVDLKNGQRTQIVKGIRSQVRLSPGGKFITWFDLDELHWMAYEIRTKQFRNISSSITVSLYDEDNDLPAPPMPHGIAGWFDDDTEFIANFAQNINQIQTQLELDLENKYSKEFSGMGSLIPAISISG